MFELNGVLHWVISGETSQVENETGIILDSDSPIDSTVVMDNTSLSWIEPPRNYGSLRTEQRKPSDSGMNLVARLPMEIYATTRSARCIWRMDSKVRRLRRLWSETRLSDSPLEAERLIVHDGFVYWSSKQSILGFHGRQHL